MNFCCFLQILRQTVWQSTLTQTFFFEESARPGVKWSRFQTLIFWALPLYYKNIFRTADVDHQTVEIFNDYMGNQYRWTHVHRADNNFDNVDDSQDIYILEDQVGHHRQFDDTISAKQDRIMMFFDKLATAIFAFVLNINIVFLWY